MLLIIFITSFIVVNPIEVENTTEPFFTLVAKTGGDPVRFSILSQIAQQIKRIGIDVELHNLEWSVFLNEIVTLHDFDLVYGSYTGNTRDPNHLGLYGENSFLNFYGYNSSMDWDDELGMGKNQWYLEHGKTMIPPDSEERLQHYWDWQQYFMDEILALKPTILPKLYTVTWSNLQGYDVDKGMKENWGKLSWDGLHEGQESTSEFVTHTDTWYQLNPLFNYFLPTGGLHSVMLEGLATYDYSDQTYYPHLAYNWTILNDTYVRVNLRQGIKWQEDPDGLFPDEYFNADDVIFSYYVWRYISDYKSRGSFKEIRKVDQYTVDFYIDEDLTTPENEPSAEMLGCFTYEILPEHYLNQTQLLDGITPDITHISWTKFSNHCFGTSLFELDSFLVVETNFQLFENCWWLDPSVDKTGMDFENRFGNFSGGLTKLKVRKIFDLEMVAVEFEMGNLDKSPVLSLPKRDEFLVDPDFDIYGYYSFLIEHLGYNLREDRPIISSREPAPGDPSITVGLAIRKAISYAINRDEINAVISGGEYLLHDHPIAYRLGKWCNPNIIRYNHDLDKAQEYMRIAGYGEQFVPETLSNKEIAGIVLSSVFAAGVISLIIYWLYRKGK
jgi:ABC-type transport system substrate-binding protein